jgi:hypothetical protein
MLVNLVCLAWGLVLLDFAWHSPASVSLSVDAARRALAYSVDWITPSSHYVESTSTAPSIIYAQAHLTTPDLIHRQELPFECLAYAD